MVRPKIAYWEFDFEAMCPTLGHDLLSQARIYIYIYKAQKEKKTKEKKCDPFHSCLYFEEEI